MSLRWSSTFRPRIARYARRSRIALVALSVALIAGRLWMSMPRAAARAAPTPSRASEQIDDREQDDPHQVDEVPVETQCLDALVVLRRVLSEEGLPGAEGD